MSWVSGCFPLNLSKCWTETWRSWLCFLRNWFGKAYPKLSSRQVSSTIKLTSYILGRFVTELAETLNRDVEILAECHKKKRPGQAHPKLFPVYFTCTNANAHHKLNIILHGLCINHGKTPMYLGIILDRTLSYHAANISAKNNLLSKLGAPLTRY